MSLLEKPSDEEFELIEKLKDEIINTIYSEKHKAPRKVILQTLVVCTLTAIQELQNVEDRFRSEDAAKNLEPKTDEQQKEFFDIMRNFSKQGFMDKLSQTIMLLIGSIGNLKTREEQLQIVQKVLDHLTRITKPKIILSDDKEV